MGDGSVAAARGDPQCHLTNGITARSDDVDLSDTAVDRDETTDFERSVYAETIKVRRGKTTTYGAIAETLRNLHAARAVGRALIPQSHTDHRAMPPCSRAGGRSGCFSGAGGVPTTLRLFQMEGAIVENQPARSISSMTRSDDAAELKLYRNIKLGGLDV